MNGISVSLSGSRGEVPAGTYTIGETPLGKGRPIRVVCIGAGYSGILMSVIVSQKLRGCNVDYQVYEMNGDLGGTWLMNK